MDNLYSSLQEQRKIGRDSLMKIYGQKSLGDEYLENLAQPLVLLNANEIPPKDSFLLYERKNFPFWVFELVIKGKGHVEIEAEQFSVSPNDIYILPQNRNHMIFSQPDAPWIKRYFLVIGTLPEYLLRSYHLENKFYFPQCKGEYFRHLFDEMIELFQLKSHDMNDRAAGVLLQLIQYLAKHAAGEKPLSAQALKIRHYLDRMLYKKLDLHRMSREIAIPRNRIIKVCKEEKKGLFILVKTSNPSSGEFQDRLIDGRPLYELVGEQVAKWGEDCMGDDYSYVGAVVGATYPEQGKVLRKIMPKSFILVPGYGAQGGKGADLVHFFNEDGLGAIVNSSRGIIAAYKQEQYAKYGEEHFAEASRAAVEAMIADIGTALERAK